MNYIKAMERSLDMARDAITKGMWNKNPPERTSYDYLREIERKVKTGAIPPSEFEYCLAWMQCAIYTNAPGIKTVEGFKIINKQSNGG